MDDEARSKSHETTEQRRIGINMARVCAGKEKPEIGQLGEGWGWSSRCGSD